MSNGSLELVPKVLLVVLGGPVTDADDFENLLEPVKQSRCENLVFTHGKCCGEVLPPHGS